MNKRIKIILGLLVVGVAVIFGLHISTWGSKGKINGFNRNFTTDPLILVKSKDISYNSYYIAGSTSKHIYLGNTTAPLHILVTDLQTADTQHVQIHLSDFKKIKLIAPRVVVDAPNFYLADGSAPAILSGNIDNWKVNRHFGFDSSRFTKAVAVSEQSMVIRTLSNSREFILGKQQLGAHSIELAPDILQKQIDGIFCIDGMLVYDKTLTQLVYIYYYRNQFISIDTNLTVLHRSKTIDTISTARIKVAAIKSNNSKTLSTPPLIVNKKACVSDSKLFINSNLIADNEDDKNFRQSSVVDVYDLKNKGQYVRSFYIPRYENYQMTDFTVTNNNLIVLYDRNLVTFNIRADFLETVN